MNAYACASKLRTLKLSALSDLNLILPPNPSELTSLEEVDLCCNSLVDCSVSAEAAASFFQAVASKLTTLRVYVKDENHANEGHVLFPSQTGIPVYPNLTSFSVVQPVLPGSNLMLFLNQHADTLRHLQLHSHSFAAIQSNPSLLPVFPHLESLNIFAGEKQASQEGLDTAQAYAQHSRDTLTSLSLMHCSFSLHDLGLLLDLFRRGSSTENVERGELKSLTVRVEVLSPQLLDMLAERVPQLESLKVYFAYLRSMDVPAEGITSCLTDLTQEEIESFVHEMKKRSYALRSFGIDSVAVRRPDRAMGILMPACVPEVVFARIVENVDNPPLISGR